ncbi:MAG: hypothetical protein WB795_08290 [Candidatus Acidiferrales bacterium]
MNVRTSRIASPAIFFALAVAVAAISLGPCMPGVLARAVSGSHALAAEPTAASSPSVLVPDKGKLHILINGQLVGREDFQIAPSGSEWIARGSTDAKPAQGASTRIMGALRLTPGGAPISYEWSTQGEKKASANIAFHDLTATIELTLEGAKPYTQQFTFPNPRIAVLDNNMYHQYAVLAHLYDWQKKGPQVVSVLVPQSMTPGSVTIEPLASPSAGNSSQQGLRVKTEDLEVDVFLEAGKLQRIAVPSASAEILREN